MHVLAGTVADHPYRRQRALLEIVFVMVAAAAAYVLETSLAAHLPWGAEARGVLAVFVGMIVAVLLTLRHDGTLAALGFKRPTRWWTVPIWALGIFIVFVVAQGAVPALLAPFFDIPQPDMSRYDAIRGNLPAAITMALVLPLTAAVPEEIVYRGFLIERLIRLFGNGSVVAAVIVQSLIFGSIHFQWGLGGVIATSIMGLVWGIAYLLCGRNLWIVILAHSTAHIALVMQLYHAPASG